MYYLSFRAATTNLPSNRFISFVTKNPKQQLYVDTLKNSKIPIVVVSGPTGTGKTMFACLEAISLLRSGAIDKVIITRPVVGVDEELGFLPGNKEKKMEVWTQPIVDVFLKVYTKTSFQDLFSVHKLEIAPLAYMRGRTFDNAFVIADEMQNSSPNQMKMLLTRMGTNCKLVITGDALQSDRMDSDLAFGLSSHNNGLAFLLNRIHMYPNQTELAETLQLVEFTDDEVERSPAAKMMVKLLFPKKKDATTTAAAATKAAAKNSDAALIPNV